VQRKRTKHTIAMLQKCVHAIEMALKLSEILGNIYLVMDALFGCLFKFAEGNFNLEEHIWRVSS
jgi:hypothetical protein